MAYSKTTWVNGSTPPINATNLNHIEAGIEACWIRWTGTQAEYDALGSYDDNTLYVIVG